MFLATYKAIRPGFQGLGSYAVRLGTNSKYSHTELVFEPGDGVESFMPDGSLERGTDNTLWAFGATASDIMPEWSERRAGRRGGCRFKRIEFKDSNWDFVQIDPAVFKAIEGIRVCMAVEGKAYDWRHIGSFLGPIANLIFRQSGDKLTCAELAARVFGLSHPELFHPYNLHVVASRFLANQNPGVVADNSDLRALLSDATAAAHAG